MASEDVIRCGPLTVDFSRSGITVRDLEGEFLAELDRISLQLKPGYRFKSDREPNNSKRDPVENHLDGKTGLPLFHTYKALPGSVAEAARRIRRMCPRARNVILIGSGGSITGAESFYHALVRYERTDRRLFIVDTMDPDHIAYVKGECNPDETIALAVSKSGTTQGVLDIFDQFAPRYRMAAVTDVVEKRDVRGRPANIYSRMVDYAAKRRADVKDIVVPHPPIGGRYTGRTAVGTLPLALLGLGEKDMAGVERGFRRIYGKTGPGVKIEGNPALRTAALCYLLEKRLGLSEIFAPMYSHRLDGFAHLTTQLLHESSGKAGEGQTILAVSAPESQHHTNQRLFGGKRNMALVFFTIANPQVTGLKASDGVPLEKALRFEYEGTRDDATERRIPNITVELESMNPESAGAFMAFLHYAFGVYPALLRDVNPFDQPQVERSKEISRQLRSNP